MTILLLIMTCFGLSSALDTILQINTISRITKDSADHFEIEVANGKIGFDHFHLNIINANGATQYQANSVTGATKEKATFKGNLNEIGAGAVEFIITQRALLNDNPLSYGDISFILPAFPSAVDSTLVGVATDYSLRISDTTTLADFKLIDKVCTATEGTPCYFVDIAKPTGELELCLKVTTTLKTDVNLCDKTFETTLDVTVSPVDPSATELQYEVGGTKAKVLITHPDKKVSSTEVIVYKEGDDSTVNACETSPCDIGSITPEDELKVITVGIDTLPTDTGYQLLKDYGVVGTPLSQTLIETRWTYQGTKGNDQYFVTIDPTDAGNTAFTETIVACKNKDEDTNFHCFAYFTGLTAGKTYKLSVQITDASTDPTKVTLTDTKTDDADTIGESEGMELKISSLDTKWHKGLRSFEVNTCVHQAHTSNLFTYEAILINKSGQWKKVNGIRHRIGNELCFDALHVGIYNFDLSEDMTLVVVKRGNDGMTVLESTQTDIYIGENKRAAALRNLSSGKM